MHKENDMAIEQVKTVIDLATKSGLWSVEFSKQLGLEDELSAFVENRMDNLLKFSDLIEQNQQEFEVQRSMQLMQDYGIYDPNTTERSCTVVCMDSSRILQEVAAINLQKNIIVKYKQPFQLGADNEFMKEEVKYASIYAFNGLSGLPVMFHCYGKVENDESSSKINTITSNSDFINKLKNKLNDKTNS